MSEAKNRTRKKKFLKSETFFLPAATYIMKAVEKR